MNLKGNELVALLGCYTVLLVVSYRRFGRAYSSYHEGWSSPDCPETSVFNNQRRRHSGRRIPQLHYSRNL